MQTSMATGGPYRTENPLLGLNWLFLSCTTVSARLSLTLRNEGRAKEETKALGSYFYMRRNIKQHSVLE